MRNLVVAVVVLAAVPCGAVEIPFRDGSLVEAASYTVNGSYLTLEMANGARVAYDIADIDLEALRRAEEAAAATVETGVEETTGALGVAGGLRLPDEGETGGIVITDQHVKHVRGSGISGPEDETEAAPADPDALPEGFEEGGNVLLNNVTVSPLEGGMWQVGGEVVNRTTESVLDVRANLQAAVPDGDPWTASVPVSGLLAPDEKATFTHTFATPEGAADGWTPQIQVSVVWMRGESRIEPNYDRLAPHPSSLPYDRGGVGGAEKTDDDVEL
ncbi:MAG: hypothetical protein MUC56_11270 [Thermoanaerobaculales bacterium]|jgi:hypothetical protein|nr:hypothetical protein [Thermoanaerobaculales bacterium]